MRYYPVSDSELRDQGRSNAVTAVAFSVASACLVFALDLTKDFAITADVPTKAMAEWGGYRLAAIIIGMVAFGVGCYLSYSRHKFVSDLKSETTFD